VGIAPDFRRCFDRVSELIGATNWGIFGDMETTFLRALNAWAFRAKVLYANC